MSDQYKLSEMPTFTLARLCEEQTAQFWQKKEYDARYCYQLWRQALTALDLSAEAEDKQKNALRLIYGVYVQQVRLWAKGHRLFSDLGRSEIDLADMAFEKMWLSFSRDKGKIDRFSADSQKGLPALLSFLKQCVNSVILDAWRQDSTHKSVPIDTQIGLVSVIEVQPYNGQQFWHCVSKRLKDETEKIAVAALFIEGLPPRKVAVLYPTYFKDAQQVSRIKTRILRRLKNDLSFERCVEQAEK